MSARLQALCCLLTLAVSQGWTGERISASPDLVVYLKSAATQSPALIAIMKAEVNALMSSARLRTEWRDERSADRTVENAELVVFELQGVCDASHPKESHGSESGSLASTAIAGGRVLPFSSVNCSALNRLLGPAIAREAPERRDFLYGRALARVMAHELFHYLALTQDHDHSGIAKSGLTQRDLLTDHLYFTAHSLARLARAKLRQSQDQELLSGQSN